MTGRARAMLAAGCHMTACMLLHGVSSMYGVFVCAGKLSCRLQDQVIRLSVPAGAADAPVMYPMSCASQSASRPTGGAHARLYGADIEEEVSMPLLPKPTRTVVSEEGRRPALR